MRNYIALDAHSKTSTFVVVDGRGRQTSYQRIKTGESEILKFLRSVKGSKALTFEESNLSKWLYTITKDEVEQLLICNPGLIARRRGPKDDYPDTVHLAQQLRGDFLTPVFHEDSFFSELRSVVSAYEDLNTDLIRMQNRYKALFRSEAHQTTGIRIYSDEERIKELSTETDRFVAHDIFGRMQLMKQQKEEYKKRFQEYANKNTQIRYLTSIPGIAEVRACMIAATVCSPHRFESKFKFWAYCMLVKYECKSDNVTYSRKRVPGNRMLKKVFMGSAESVLNFDKGSLRAYYDEQRERGVDHRAAKKNLARKIAAIALSIMRKTTPYQEDYEVKKKKSANKV